VRVLVWSDLFWPYIGGPEVLIARLMVDLRERGHEFLVLTSHDYLDLPDEDSYEGIPIRRFPFREALGERALEKLRAAHEGVTLAKRDFGPALVHANVLGPSLFFHLRTLDAHPAPWLVWLQQEVLPGQANGKDTLLDEALRSAGWVAACSQSVLMQARRAVPEIAGRSSVIRNAAEPGPEPEDPLPEQPHLVCLGRLLPVKGFDVALDAVALLVERFAGVRLTIAGEGPARAELERRTAALGLNERVVFAGWVEPERVRELLRSARIVVMPSRREGLPVAAVEAAAMARPIVASRVGGLPEVVEHGRTGLLVDPDDPRGVAEAIASLLERPEVTARLGRAARESVRETLSLERCADAFDELYRTLTWR
jgi:glycogen(starch) synthase